MADRPNILPRLMSALRGIIYLASAALLIGSFYLVLALMAFPPLLIPYIALWIVLGGLVVLTFSRTRRQFCKRSLTPLAGLIFIFFGTDAYLHLRFYVQRQSLEAALPRLLEGDPEICAATGCRVDDGPPKRVAFIWHGLLDNWTGLCFDPTGLIDKARWPNEESPLTETERAAVSLFGGTVTDGTHLTGDWYLCSAT